MKIIWAEGLVSAAKLVGVGSNLLIEKADKLVNGDGSLDENRIGLINAKNEVSTAGANLVALAKSCSHIIDEKSEAFDIDRL
jgi:hypothetical protein